MANKKRDIRLNWSKRERDVMVHWDIGHKATAMYILDHICNQKDLYGSTFKKELIKRDYDITTLRISIDKLKSITNGED